MLGSDQATEGDSLNNLPTMERGGFGASERPTLSCRKPRNSVQPIAHDRHQAYIQLLWRFHAGPDLFKRLSGGETRRKGSHERQVSRRHVLRLVLTVDVTGQRIGQTSP